MQYLEYSYSKIVFVVYSELKLNCETKVTQLCLKTLCVPMDCNSPGFSVPWNSPGKNIEVGCHSLLQGSFLTQGLNLGLRHCRQILFHLSHRGSPKFY